MKYKAAFGALIASVLWGALWLAPATSVAADAAKPAAKKSIRVAILPVHNATQELSATKIMDDVLREQLANVPAERATFLYPFDTERILTGRNEIDRAYRLTERWAKVGTIDSTAIAGIDSILMSDAILFVKVNEWENHRVPVIGAGSSYATVGFTFACYDVRTKKQLWRKDPREQRFGQEIDPTSGTVNYDETGFIQNKRANDPPRYEDVAADLVREAFKKFPEK
jgi:hypothetical protein